MGLERTAEGGLGGIGGLDQGLGLRQQGRLIGFQRQGVVGPGVEDDLGRVRPAVQRVGGDDAALQAQQRQGLLSPQNLVAPGARCWPMARRASTAQMLTRCSGVALRPRS